MPERAVALHEVAGELGFGQLGGALAGVDGAEARQPVRDLDEGDAPPPRAPMFDATGEAGHGAQRAEIARDVVERLHRQVAWLGERTLRGGKAGHVLDDRIEAAALRPRTFVAVGADADADDAGPERRHLLRRETAAGDRAGAIALGENVGPTQQA